MWPGRFHVDKLSSAHVYIRLPEGQTIEDIAEALLEDCAQLVKQNSIEGCKHAVSVVYTPWSNLKKTSDMAPGQVSFHDRKKVRTCPRAAPPQPHVGSKFAPALAAVSRAVLLMALA